MNTPRRTPAVWLAGTRLATAVRLHSPVRRPHVRRAPVAWLRGRTPSGNLLTVLMAGDSPFVDRTAKAAFEGEPEVEPLRPVWYWQVPALLDRIGGAADLVVARVPPEFRKLFGPRYLRAPEWVRLARTAPGGMDSVRRSTSLNSDLRIARRSGFTVKWCHDEQVFEMFHDRMHVPMMKQRFGAEAGMVNFYYMRRMFRRGGLAVAVRAGVIECALLVDIVGDRLIMRVFGSRGGSLEPFYSGGGAILYRWVFENAAELGCTLIDCGTVLASLDEGLLRYKRKWGFKIWSDEGSRYDMRIGWSAFNPAVEEFFSLRSLILYDGDGFSALKAVGAGPVAAGARVARRLLHNFGVAGLRRFFLLNSAGWLADPDSVPHGAVLVASLNEVLRAIVGGRD